jgi:hypothetical protein
MHTYIHTYIHTTGEETGLKLTKIFLNMYSGGWNLKSTRHCGHQWPIVPAPGDYDDGEIGGMNGRGNRSTRRKPAPVPLCPPQTPRAARMRTRAAAVGSTRLTAWATARPLKLTKLVCTRYLCHFFDICLVILADYFTYHRWFRINFSGHEFHTLQTEHGHGIGHREASMYSGHGCMLLSINVCIRIFFYFWAVFSIFIPSWCYIVSQISGLDDRRN